MDLAELITYCFLLYLTSSELTEEQKKHIKKNDLIQQLKEDAVKLYEAKEAEFPEIEQLRKLSELYS